MLSKITDMKMCSVSLTTKLLVYCQLHYTCTSICIFTSNNIINWLILSRRERIFVEGLLYLHLEIYGKLLWCLPFWWVKDVLGHQNIDEHWNTLCYVCFTLLVYFSAWYCTHIDVIYFPNKLSFPIISSSVLQHPWRTLSIHILLHLKLLSYCIDVYI